MSVFTVPRDPRLERALHQAREWCEGHEIDNKPAYEHAVRVARCLDEHIDDLSVEVAIAALLHDAPDFAPDDLDLDAHLTEHFGHPVPRIVRTLHAEHEALNAGDPEIDTTDMLTLYVSTADKIVAFRSMLERAHKSGDATAFFASREALAARMPYFQRFTGTVTGLVPDSMSANLREVLATISSYQAA